MKTAGGGEGDAGGRNAVGAEPRRRKRRGEGEWDEAFPAD